MSHCSKHLKECNAQCCKGFWITIKPEKEMWKYFNLHLTEAEINQMTGTEEVTFWIDRKCKWLNEKTLQCSHYHERPSFCRTWFCERFK